MSLVSEVEITAAIRKILALANLESLSRKIVRQQLEDEFCTDLSNRKAMINEKIAEIMDEIHARGEEDEDEDDEDEEDEGEDIDDEEAVEDTVKKSKEKASKSKSRGKRKVGDGGVFNAAMLLSPELSEFMNETEMSRPQLVKRMWEYIRENGLQNPKDKREILLDDKLRSVFKRDVFTMFTMNKYISRHMKKEDSLPEGGWAAIQRNGESSEEDAEKVARKKRKRKEVVTKRKKSKKGKVTSAKSGLNKPLLLSDELAKFVGRPEMSRAQVVKVLWEYIREHKLQNPENRKEIHCDQALGSLLGEMRVTMFSMNKYLGKHFIKS